MSVDSYLRRILSSEVNWSSNQTIRWKPLEPVSAGVFRVWAVSAKGTRDRVTRASTPPQ